MNDLIDRDVVLHEIEKAHSFEDHRGQLAHAIQVIKNTPAVNRWIPCKERLPESGISVLICACKHRVTAYYDNCKNVFRLTEDENLFYESNRVSHWRPLPNPPEDE